MSEASEKVRAIKSLPLFPLSIVLLPHEILPLHIFEPRYRKMLADVQAGNRLFGLSFFDSQTTLADAALPEIGSVGCAAEVREAQTLDDGRSNILTIGTIRYRLESYVETDEPYLIARISFFEDAAAAEDENRLSALADETFEIFMRIVNAAHELSGERGGFPDISRADPQQLSFLVAAALNLEPEIKYEFLQMRSTVDRLERLRAMLAQSVRKVEESAAINKVAKTNGHSKKKINL
jgi:Lon protease-like protein